MISEFVEEIKDKINHKKEYHKNFYEKLGQKLNDNDLHKATQLAFDECMEIINKFAEEYKDVPDTNVGKWIPVSEKLPEKYIPVLVMLNNKQMCVFTLETDFEDDLKVYWADWYDYPKKISETIAWMPLPEPFKGE